MGGTNPNNHGKWMHVYYTFTSENSSTAYDHYIITLENNCAGSNGADYLIDDIRAYVCKPNVGAMQLQPVCNGETSTRLKLTGSFESLLNSLGANENTVGKGISTKTFYYCFVDSTTFYDKYAEYTKNISAEYTITNAYNDAFNDALVTDTYDDYHDNYGTMIFDCYYDGNEEYTTETYKDAIENKKYEALRQQEGTARNLIFPCNASDAKMYADKTYIIAICSDDPTNPRSYDITDACAKISTFEIIFSGEVKIDGTLASKDDGASICANQVPVITIDMNGVGIGGQKVQTKDAYFDWYLGPIYLNAEEISQGYTEAYKTVKGSDEVTELQDAMGYFREYYPTDADLSSPATDSYTEAMRTCIKEFVDAGKLVLYKNSSSLSTMQQFNNMLDPDAVKKYYITAIPIDPKTANVTFCLSPIKITINLNTRTPRMKNGDDSKRIPYPDDMRDVPLRIGLAQLKKPVIDNLDATTADHFLYMPLRDIVTVTDGVKSLIQKSTDTFVYLAASTDPNVAAGTSGATAITGSDLKVIGKVMDINADKDLTGNVCRLAFLKAFNFREGYTYTIKFNFEENYSDVLGDHSDVCPGEVVCTIKVVPEYQKWTGSVDSNWNNDANWERVSISDLNMTADEAFVKEIWSNADASPNCGASNVTQEYNKQTGTYILHNGNDRSSQWALVLHYDTSFLTYDPAKTYRFYCKINSNKEIQKVTWKFDDINTFHSYDHDGDITIPVGDYTFIQDGITGADLASACHKLMFAFGFAKSGTDITISNISLTESDDDKKALFTDGGTNDNTSSFVPADFTKVIIPANTTNPPRMYNLRTGTASTDANDASTNLTIVSYAGNPTDCDYIKNMDVNKTAAIGDATTDINYDMSSIDLTGTSNVACRSWYDHTCQYIHFESEAQMLSQQYLNYEKAWADFEMVPNKWTTISSPLEGVVAGDFYLPTASGRQDTPLFEDITFKASLHDRFNPAVFQRSWNASNAKVVHLSGDNTNSAVSLAWSDVYNDVNVDYSSGVGFAIKPDVSMMTTKPTKVKFRLPKGDTNYYYWNPDHEDGTTKSETVTADLDADGSRLHKLADFTAATPFEQVVGQSGATDTQYFLVGNPMMCYLNMTEFFNQNSSLEKKYWIVSGKGQRYTVFDDKTDGYVGTVDNTFIAPFQSFFVALKSGQSESAQFTPQFTTGMMAIKNTNGSYLTPDGSTITPVTNAKVMNICATDSLGNESSVILLNGKENHTVGVETLFDSNLQMSGCPTLYTNKNGEAMSLTEIMPGDTIPVALSGARSKVSIKISGVDNIDVPLYIIDAETGEMTELTEDVVLQQSENGIRYYITSIAEDEAVAPTMPRIVTDGCTLTAYAPDCEAITKLNIFRTDGALVTRAKDISQSYSVTLNEGIYLVEITTPTYHSTVKICLHE